MMTKPRLGDMTRTAVGEQDFEVLYHEHVSRIYNFFRYRFGDGSLAEDLTSVTFEKAWKNRERYRRDLASFSTWLFTVARNLYTSWCRHRSVDATRVVDAPESWPPPAPGESPFEAAARNETERRLERALARLPLADRELLLMIVIGGLSHSEAAGVIGLRPEVLRKRLQRARERLAAALDAEGALGRRKVG